MREAVLFLRERQSDPDRPDGSVRAFLLRHRPSWAVAAAGGVVMSGVGAFGTGSAAPWTLYSYWLTLMVAGSLVSAALIDRFEARQLFAANFWKAAVGLV